MPTPGQWARACAALDDLILREILLDNPAAGKLLVRRLKKYGRLALPRPPVPRSLPRARARPPGSKPLS